MKKKTSASIGTLALVLVIVMVRALVAPAEGDSASDSASPERPQRSGDRTPAPRDPTPEGAGGSDAVVATVASEDALIERLFRERRSDEMVTAVGDVDRTLPDDNVGSRHQKFILELATGRTLLISHNIDLAPRVPLDRGDRVIVRGEYEWTERGGVVHWTHHDPKQWREGGWIEHEGQRYE